MRQRIASRTAQADKQVYSRFFQHAGKPTVFAALVHELPTAVGKGGDRFVGALRNDSRNNENAVVGDIIADGGRHADNNVRNNVGAAYVIADIFATHDIDTEIISASVRHPIHVTECALAGADIATVPYSVIWQMTKHPLTEQGIEKFKKDYEAVFGK